MRLFPLVYLFLLLGIAAVAQPAPASLEQQLDTVQARAVSGLSNLHDTAVALLNANQKLAAELEETKKARDALQAELDKLKTAK